MVEDKLKAASGEEARSKVLKDQLSAFSESDLADFRNGKTTGSFADFVKTVTSGEGHVDSGLAAKMTAEIDELLKSGGNLNDFGAGIDKVVGSVGGTGKSSAETAAELLKLNGTFKAVTKTTEEVTAAAEKRRPPRPRRRRKRRRKKRTHAKLQSMLRMRTCRLLLNVSVRACSSVWRMYVQSKTRSQAWSRRQAALYASCAATSRPRLRSRPARPWQPSTAPWQRCAPVRRCRWIAQR